MSGAARDALLLYCRAGFEKECAQDITHACEALGVAGWCRATPHSGYVLFHPGESGGMALLRKRLRFADLVFARQIVFASGPWVLAPENRLPPLLEAASRLQGRCGRLWLETADTNEAKALSGFCHKFEPHLGKALTEAGLLDRNAPTSPTLHVFFLDSLNVWVGVSLPGNAADWPMGIPRLKMPREAPSRSTLKLAEAIKVLLNEGERAQLRAGKRAVDLGASPGGWTWQLTQRGMTVTAVDNGPMDPALIESGLVEHVRADGFTFRPRHPVDWLVCDMVEKPARVVDLICRWFERGDCRAALFNLKLPMKRRFEAVQDARSVLDARLRKVPGGWRVAMRQLYHDREEITCLVSRQPG